MKDQARVEKPLDGEGCDLGDRKELLIGGALRLKAKQLQPRDIGEPGDFRRAGSPR